MSRSVSQLRLEIKSSKVDDVPTFAPGGAGVSEPLTFCNRSGNSSRPKPLYRPAGSSSFSVRSTEALFEDDDNDEEMDMLSDDEASPLQNFPEQRDNSLVSNSAASVVGLSIQQTASRVEILDAGHGQNRVKVEQVDRPLAHSGSSTTQPIPISAKKVRFLGVKQEDVDDSAPHIGSSTVVESRRMFLGAVKDEPSSPTLTSSSASEASKDNSFARSDAPSPQPATSQVIPSIVITEAPNVERKPKDKIESAPLSLRCPPLYELFSRTGCYTYQCLALIHAGPPCHELLLKFRYLAHYLLQVSQSPKIKLAAKEPEDMKALKKLRDTLKDVLKLTSIVKLDTVAVPSETWTRATDTCVRRLKKIAALVDRMLRAPFPRTLCEPR